MAKQINIKVKVDEKPIKDLVNDLDKLKDGIKDASNADGLKKLNEELGNTKKQLDSVEEGAKAFNLDQIMEETAEGSIKFGKALGKLEAELRRLYHAGENNTEEFKRIQQEAANMRSSIDNLNRETTLLGANDGIEQFGTGLGQVGTSLKNLDFKTASMDAEMLVGLSKNMSFKTATDGLKNLGKTFTSVGKALLTNPLFLVAAVVAAIVVVIVKLMKEVGVLQIALDMLGKYIDILMTPINLLIDGLKSLTDWFGWTSHAAAESAEIQAEASKKAADAAEKANNSQMSDIDRKIALMKVEGKDTRDLERQKVVLLQETAKARVEEAEDALKAAILKGDLDAEELEDLEEKLQELKDINAERIKDIEHFDEMTEAMKKRAAVEDEIKNNQDLEKENQEKENQRKQDNENYKVYLKNRLDAQRTIKDLEIEAMAEGDEKELELNRVKYERLIEDTLSNENLLQSEKDEMIKYYEGQREQRQIEINQREKDREQAKKDQEEADRLLKEQKEEEDRLLELEKKAKQDELLRELTNSTYQNELDDIQKRLDKELEMAGDNEELKTALRAKAAQDVIRIEEEKAAAEKAIRDANIDSAKGGISMILQAATEAAGEGSAVAKAAAVAAISMDTISGAMSAFNSMAGIPIIGPILGGAAAAAVGVMGAMNIKKVMAVKTPGGGGGGGGSTPMPAKAQTPSSTPDVNLYGRGESSSEGRESNSSTERGVGVQRIRAEVSWSDLKEVEEKDRRTRNESFL